MAAQVVACGGSDADGSQTGTLNGSSTVGCVAVSTTPVEWHSDAALGHDGQVFAAVEGKCEAPFSWDGSVWSNKLAMSPMTGQGTLTTAITVAHDSLRLVDYKPRPSGHPFDSPCGPTLEADASVTVSLDGRRIVENHPVVLQLPRGDDLSEIQFSLSQSQVSSWLTLVPAEADALVQVSVSMMPLQWACAGDINLWVQQSANQAKSSTDGVPKPFATWSNTACEMGQVPVPDVGVGLADEITDAFTGLGLPATWSDRSRTVFDLRVSAAGDQACADPIHNGNRFVYIPLEVVASTSDDRIVGLTGKGTATVSLLGGAWSEFEVFVSTDLGCASVSDRLAYRSVDCTTTRSVTAQLDLRHARGASTSTGNLRLYVHQRESAAAPGAADRVDELTFDR